MTNQELFSEFIIIYLMENGFDQHLALKQLTKRYKTSLFYKKTHYSVNKAFKIFCKSQYNNLIKAITAILNPSELAEKVNIFVDDLDMDKINYLLEELTTKLDVATLIKDKEFLTESINKLKS